MLKTLQALYLNTKKLLPFSQVETANNVAAKMEKIEIAEGSAKIQSENRVFYNPVQEFNRDISILVLSTFWKLCQWESEQRKTGVGKLAGVDFPVSIFFPSSNFVIFRFCFFNLL